MNYAAGFKALPHSFIMLHLGTNYGGWHIPTDIGLDEHSVVYSGGVGEDISFDILLQDKFKSSIVLIDPTERADIHYQQVIEFYRTGIPAFTGDIQKSYVSKIRDAKPDFSKFTFLKKGLWSETGDLKFYKPTNDKYVSSTLIENMYSDRFTVVPVDTIKNVQASLGHTHIDLLKLDIEGSEISVLNRMLDDKIYPRYICVEFDLKLKGVDSKMETEALIGRLEKEGYTMKHNANYNCLFVRS